MTPGQAHDLAGADALLPDMAADTLVADKAFDADERALEPLLARRKSFVIPPRRKRKTQRDFDKDGYKAEAEMSRRLGYIGKSCIHPTQVPLANAVFRPS